MADELEYPVLLMHRRAYLGERGTMTIGRDRLTLVDRHGAVVMSEPWNRLHSFHRTGNTLFHVWAGEQRYTVSLNPEKARLAVLAEERGAIALPELARRMTGSAPSGFVAEPPKYLRQALIAVVGLLIVVGLLVLIVAAINGDIGGDGGGDPGPRHRAIAVTVAD